MPRLAGAASAPSRLVCPACASTSRRRFRAQGYYDAYRCRECDRYYTLLSGTAFEGSRQRPATLVLLLRGITKGESTARLARELDLSRQTVHTLRQRIQTNLNDNAPTDMMNGQTFEVDELYQNAGEKSTPHRDSDDPRARRPVWYSLGTDTMRRSGAPSAGQRACSGAA